MIMLWFTVCSYDYVNDPGQMDKNIFGRFMYEYIYLYAGQSLAKITWCVVSFSFAIFIMKEIGIDVDGKIAFLFSKALTAKKKFLNSQFQWV